MDMRCDGNQSARPTHVNCFAILREGFAPGPPIDPDRHSQQDARRTSSLLSGLALPTGDSPPQLHPSRNAASGDRPSSSPSGRLQSRTTTRSALNEICGPQFLPAVLGPSQSIALAWLNCISMIDSRRLADIFVDRSDRGTAGRLGLCPNTPILAPFPPRIQTPRRDSRRV